MVDVVHQVFIVSPEILHVHRLCAAGDPQRAVVIAVGIRIQDAVSIHVVHSFLGVHVQIALAACAVRKSHVVLFEYVQVQMQHCGTFYDLVSDIVAALFKAGGGIAVEILQSVIRQIEIRHGDLHMRKHSLLCIVAHDGNAVVGQGEIHRLCLAVISARSQRRAGTCRKQQRKDQQRQ